MLWMLCGASYTLSIASAYDRNTSSQGWGYQPLQTSSSTTGYTAERPTFHFQSTSILISPSDMEPMQMMGGNALLSSIWDDQPSGPGTGELEDPTPVGDIPWIFLLLLIVGYIALRSRRAKMKV